MDMSEFSLIAPSILLTACSWIGPEDQTPAMIPAEVTFMQTTDYERQWWRCINDDVMGELVTQILVDYYSLAAFLPNTDRGIAHLIDIDNESLPSGSAGAEFQYRKSQQPDESTERSCQGSDNVELAIGSGWKIVASKRIDTNQCGDGSGGSAGITNIDRQRFDDGKEHVSDKADELAEKSGEQQS